MSRAERIEAALSELVALKDIKDRLDHPSIADLDRGQLPAMRRAYESRKPIAWSEARAALALPGGPKPLPDHDNHHNALLCPYCNPRGLVLVEPAATHDAAITQASGGA